MSVATAAVTAGTFGKVLCIWNPAKFNGFGDVFLNRMLQVMHFLLGVEEAGRNRVAQQCVTVFFKGRDFRRIRDWPLCCFSCND